MKEHTKNSDMNVSFPTSATQPECKSTSVHPKVSKGKFFIKIPVVLAEESVTVNMEAKITFPVPVLEIKAVKKRLKITQCRLIPGTSSVFLSGFVRKNFQFSTPSMVSPTSVSSTIESLTVDVPFTCSTRVTYLAKPVFEVNPPTSEFEFFTSTPLPTGFAKKDSLMAGDLTEFNQMSGETLNELPFCEILSTSFTELDEALNPVHLEGGPFEESIFTMIQEKMAVTFVFKLLQNQQLRVISIGDCSFDDDCDK